MMSRKELLNELLEKSEVINTNFFNELASILEIDQIDQDVKTYIKTHYKTELIDGPFVIQGANESIKEMFCFQELFKFWEGGESKDKLVPILNLGHNGQYERFFVIIETGQIISTHFDSFIEDAYTYGHNCEYNPKQFLLDLAEDYCLIKLSNVLDLQNQLVECPDFDSVHEKFSYKEMQKLTAKCFGWTLKELDEKNSHPGMNFAYFLLEED